MNKGKVFEQEWRKSSEGQDLLIIRLTDSDLSFNPNKELRSKFTVKQPCDYIMHFKGQIIFLELKSTRYSSLSIQREDINEEKDKMIKLHQINSLTNLSLFPEAQAGFVLNFRTEKEGVPYSEDTYYISIQNFNNFLCKTDKKSINKLDIIDNGGIVINAKQRRKLYTYDVKDLLNKVCT